MPGPTARAYAHMYAGLAQVDVAAAVDSLVHAAIAPVIRLDRLHQRRGRGRGDVREERKRRSEGIRRRSVDSFPTLPLLPSRNPHMRVRG